MAAADRAHVRLAELVAALSLGIDLGFGQPVEHVLRQCLIALRMAERAALDEEQRAVVYYTALLLNVGCHTDAHEQAKWFGDDFALKSLKYEHGLRSVGGAAATMRLLGSGNPPLHRFRIGLEFAISGRRDMDGMVEHHASMARVLGEQLGLPEDVLVALASAYEQWDGRGRADGDLILAGLDEVDSWQAVVGAEPALAVVLSGERFDAALAAIANFIDLKSPYFLGHSVAVAELVAQAGRQLGLSEGETRALWRAGIVHDLGRLGVSNAILDERGPLGGGEWERVRFQPYLTERMLEQSEALQRLGAIAVQHRERLDGSGYPRGLSGAAISRPARLLGAADAYQAMRESRPHRPALTAETAAMELRAEVKAGRMDADAAEAVLGAAGHRVPRRREGPAGLIAREVEVLRLLARGLSNKQIASRLVISPKTVSNHVEHIYAKIDASSRAAAGLFAMQHGLLPEEELAPSVAAAI